MLLDGKDLISLLSIIPNIHCLHISMRHIHYVCDSSLWSSIILPDLVEFHFWTEMAYDWTLDELIIILKIMPALQRLSLNIVTGDVRLLDREQIRSGISVVNNLNMFSYAVEYCGASLEHSIISNLTQKWLPQPIAFTFDAEYCNIVLYTIPFKFHVFWTRKLPLEVKKICAKQELILHYGEGACIDQCLSHIPAELSDLYTIMQKSCHIEELTLCLPNNIERNVFGKYLKTSR